MRTILLICFLFIVILSNNLVGQHIPFNAGLYFSGNREIENSAFLDVTNKQRISLGTKFSIGFELSIWNPQKYGIIYDFNDEQNKFALRFTYDKASNRDTSFFVLSVLNDSIRLKVPIAKTHLHRGAWQSWLFTVDAGAGSIIIDLDSLHQYRTHTNSFYRSVNATLAFGLSEDPTMALRNIKILDNRDIIHYYPLYETEGIKVHDIIGGNNGIQVNLEWLAPNHHRWKFLQAFTNSTYLINGIKNRLFGSAFYTDTKHNSIVSYDNGVIKSYFWQTNEEHTISSFKPTWLQGLFLDTINHRLLRYQTGLGNLSVYDSMKKSFSPLRYENPDTRQYYGEQLFVNPLNGDILEFGGYGWFTMKNQLMRYSFAEEKWDTIAVAGERPAPRNGVGFTFLNDSTMLLAGGSGNQNGKQSDGFYQFVDLWSLNLRTYTFVKLWEQPPRYDCRGAIRIVMLDSSNVLFAIDHHYNPDVYITFQRTNLSGSYVEQLEDTLHGEMLCDLWKDDANNSVFVFTHDSTNTHKLYSINQPLLFPNEYTLLKEQTVRNISKAWYGITIGTLVLGLSGLFVYIAQRKSKAKKRYDESSDVERKPSSIQLFGTFKVVDSMGRDITFEFTPKITQLFLLVLLSKNGDEGITTETLSTILWPELAPYSVKNVRGVSFYKLRLILTKVGNIQIEHDHKKWHVVFGDGIYCDYWEYKQRGKILNGDIIGLEKMLSIVGNGELIGNIYYECLDGLKTSINQEVLNILQKQLNNLNDNDSTELQIMCCDAILKYDSINEKAFERKIKKLSGLGKINEAKITYDIFSNEYKSILDKSYPKQLTELI
jgi:hypothetical protein